MAEETTAGTGKDESQDRKVFVPSGRPIRDGLREMKIAEIQPEERIIHGLLRRSLKRWELWGGTRKLALALFVGFVLWLLYHYLGLLVPIMVSILLFLVIPYEYFEADAEDRKDVIRVRVYRPLVTLAGMPTGNVYEYDPLLPPYAILTERVNWPWTVRVKFRRRYWPETDWATWTPTKRPDMLAMP